MLVTGAKAQIAQTFFERSLAIDAVSALVFLEATESHNAQSKIWLQRFSRRRFVEDSSFDPISAKVLSKARQKQVRFNATYDDRTWGLCHGWAGKGLRLLHERPFTAEHRKGVANIIDLMTRNAKLHGGHLYLEHLILDYGMQPVASINFGALRGLPGIIEFLSICVPENIRKARCLKLIEGLIGFIQMVDKKAGANEIPRHVLSTGDLSWAQSGWQYGDATAGYAIAIAGARCQRRDWQSFGERVFFRGARPSARTVKTPFISSGAAGLALLNDRFHDLSDLPETKKNAEFWVNHGYKLWEARYRDLEKREYRRKVPTIWTSRGPRPGVATLLDSGLGLELVARGCHGDAQKGWDSMFALSNPRSRELL